MRQATPSRVRVVGRRIYLDFLMPEGAPVAAPPAPRPAAVGARPAPPAAPDQSARLLADGATRFEEIRPFLMSATTAATPNPAVLKALGETVGALQRSLQDMSVSAAATPQLEVLKTAAAMAAESVDSGFRGDRAAKAREAVALFSANRVAPGAPELR